jgi:hypothetical protein
MLQKWEGKGDAVHKGYSYVVGGILTILDAELYPLLRALLTSVSNSPESDSFEKNTRIARSQDVCLQLAGSECYGTKSRKVLKVAGITK